MAACNPNTNPEAPTTDAPTQTSTPTATLTESADPTITEVPTITNTPTMEPAEVPTSTPVPTATPTPTPEPTATNTPTPTFTPTPSPTNTPTPTPSPSPTNTPKPTATSTPTPTPAPSFKFSGTVGNVTLVNENPKEYKFRIQNETDEELYIDAVSSNDYVVNVYMETLESGLYNYKFVIIGRESGTADVTLAIYGKDTNGDYNVIYDQKIIKVTVNIEKEDEDVWYSDVIARFPYKQEEWKYGEYITVSLWLEEANKDTSNGAIIVDGTGDMWTIAEADETEVGSTPWHHSDYSDYVSEIHVSEGITRVEGLSLPTATTLALPSTLRIIGKQCFKNGEYTNIVIPDGVERIEGGAFVHCNKITSVTLPSTLTYIGYGIVQNRWDIEVIFEEGFDTSGLDPEWNVFTFLEE